MSANTTVFEAREADRKGSAKALGLVLACRCGKIHYSVAETYQDGYGTWCRECGNEPETELAENLTKPFHTTTLARAIWSHGKCYGTISMTGGVPYITPNRKQSGIESFKGLRFGDLATAEDALRRHLTKSAL